MVHGEIENHGVGASLSDNFSKCHVYLLKEIAAEDA